MKIQLYLTLNWTPGDGLPGQLSCPTDLSFILDNLQIDEYAGTADSEVRVSQQVADRIVEWGSQTFDGISVLRNVRYDERYELDDLRDSEIVEVYPGLEVQLESGFGDNQITNRREALTISHACEYCDRVNVSQVVDYKVKLHPKIDLQHTIDSQWIVSHKLYDLFNQYGCQLRSTENKGYSQLIVDEHVLLDVDKAPLVRVPSICPSCGLYIVSRTDYVSGFDPMAVISKAEPVPTIYKDMPVTVVNASPQEVGFATGFPDLPLASISDKPLYKVGSTADFNALFWSYVMTRRKLYFANPSLVRSLYEMGATGMMFRPVKMAKEFANLNGGG